MKVSAILVDDEDHNRSILKTLLLKYCPDVDVIGEADEADEAFEKIGRLKPQLVFLDIRMAPKSGFDLLKMFDRISFEVVFVSAFDEYAIRAFEYNALGYILKPVDYTQLIKTTARAIERINVNADRESVINLLNSMSDRNDTLTKLSIHHAGKVVFINISDIAFIEANIAYCTLCLHDGLHYQSSQSLKIFEDLLKFNKIFVRINKSMIVNVNYIKSYTKGAYCEITMSGGQVFEASRRKKTEVLSIFQSLSI